MTAIASIAFRAHEHLCCLHAFKDLLLQNTLHWPAEIRTPERAPVQGDETVSARELQMAKSLVRNLALNTVDPPPYRDEYRTALVQLVNVQVDGARWSVPPGGRWLPS